MPTIHVYGTDTGAPRGAELPRYTTDYASSPRCAATAAGPFASLESGGQALPVWPRTTAVPDHA